MKRGAALAALCCLAGTLLLSWGPCRGEEARRLSFLFTNDVQGYIEPCG